MNSLHDNSESNLAHLVPLLDEAINQLRPVDRSAIVMRFFEQRDFRSIAEALGASENAAQKRVARALEQLHTILKRRGVACSSTALGLALTGTTAKSAPAGLATSIAAMALVKVPTQTGIVLNALKLMTASNLKTTLIGAVVVVGIITPLFVQEQGQAKLRDQQDALQQLQLELAAAQINIGRAETGNLRANFPASLSNDEFRELLRLRGEIWKLRETDDKLRKAKQFRDTDDHLAADHVWSERVNRLKAWLQAHPSEAIPELSQLPDKTWINSIYPFALETDDDYRQAMAVVRDNAESPTRNALFAALRQYVANDNGQWPTGVPQLAPYFAEPLDAAVLARYAIVPASTLVPELQTGSEWAITENAPIDDYDDRFAIGLTNSAMANSMVTNRWTALP